MCPPLTLMHWRHRFPMLFIKLSDTGIGRKTRHKYPQQSELGGRALSSIRMKSLKAANGRTYGSRISSRYIRPYGPPKACRSLATERDPCLNQDSTTSITASFTVLDCI
ncbi:hypothetical protein TNCV_4472061 [Trichonephila clavipes]|uniref:Uncharacterized protein n=1 Tax=Trichonephila clavipes TaxID=2585209 RepID=A0A8X6SHC9_TRICX|nr:hypothetical protein TNCV_4472061 [Trichonephila clavipes]